MVFPLSFHPNLIDQNAYSILSCNCDMLKELDEIYSFYF